MQLHFVICVMYSKVRSRQDRGICCVLALLVLFAGMCLEITKADSLFLSAKNSQSTAYSSHIGGWSNCEFSTAEMSGVRSQAYIASAVRRAGTRNGMRLSIMWLVTSIFLSKVSDLQAIVETAEAPVTRYVTALLHYRQKQDGKK